MDYKAKKVVNTDKSLNKDTRITVRLTANQNLEIDYISQQLKLSKAALIRRITDNFINKYYELNNGEQG